jgi:hypothetical protein
MQVPHVGERKGEGATGWHTRLRERNGLVGGKLSRSQRSCRGEERGR